MKALVAQQWWAGKSASKGHDSDPVRSVGWSLPDLAVRSGGIGIGEGFLFYG